MKKIKNEFVFAFVFFLGSTCLLQANPDTIEGKIAFYSNRGGKEGLYLYDGEKIKFLVSPGAYTAWFRSGEKLLVADAGPVGKIIDTNGKILETITTKDKNIIHPVLLKDESGFVFSSKDYFKKPDGTEMSKGLSNLYLYDFKTKETTNLTSFHEAGDILSFDLSPDNEWIAYTWGPPDTLTAGYIINMKTKETTEFAKQAHVLQWSKDGKIYYDSGVIDGQNGNLKEGWAGFFAYDPKIMKSQLILDNFSSMGFDFSPDGRKIIYSDFYAKGMFLFTLDLEIKKREPLFLAKQMSDEDINDTDPAWYDIK